MKSLETQLHEAQQEIRKLQGKDSHKSGSPSASSQQE